MFTIDNYVNLCYINKVFPKRRYSEEGRNDLDLYDLYDHASSYPDSRVVKIQSTYSEEKAPERAQGGTLLAYILIFFKKNNLIYRHVCPRH